MLRNEVKGVCPYLPNLLCFPSIWATSNGVFGPSLREINIVSRGGFP